MSGDIASIYGGDSVAIDKENAKTGDFELIPVGWYPAEIEKAEVRENKKKNGKLLWVQFVILESPAGYANRKMFASINLLNPSEEAVRIGRQELDGLGSSCGFTALKDTSELIGKTLDIRVVIKKGDNGFEDDNKIGGYAVIGTKNGKVPAKGAAKKGAAAPTTKAWDKKPDPQPAGSAAAAAPPPAAAAGAAGEPAKAAAPAPAKRPWER